MAARAIWKGSISFGLVNIPIKVYSATQKEAHTSFNQLCDKGNKTKYKKWCTTSLKVKGKSSRSSTAAKAKGKMGIAVSK